MEHPEQLGELLGWLWFNQPPESFGALTNRLAPGPAQVRAGADQGSARHFHVADGPGPARVRSVRFADDAGADQSCQLLKRPEPADVRLADGKFRLLYVRIRRGSGQLPLVRELVEGDSRGCGRTCKPDRPKEDWAGVVVHYTGRPVFVEEIATSMQHDMSHSVGATSVIIALLFWLTHRRWRPMLWLLALLMLILGATLALGGLVLGTISVVSLGFAAVLLGLAVDYAVVHYQEALAHPQMTVPEIRRAIAPSILWAAITTMSAFLVLNLGGLPGLGQLGTLVAIGIGLSALVMVMIYLPPLFPDRRKPRPNQPPFRWWNYFVAPQEAPATGYERGRLAREFISRTSRPRSALLLTGLILLGACAVLCFRQPGLDRTGNALQPQHGEAQTTLDEITSELGLPPQPLWLIISGKDETEVYQRLTKADALLDGAVSNHVIGQYLLPTALWPRVEYQAANRATAAVLGKQGPLLRDAALGEGFNTNALVLTEELVRTWARAGASTDVFWPTNQVSQWLLKRFVARTPDEWLVMGLVYPATNRVEAAALADLSTTSGDKRRAAFRLGIARAARR